MMTRVRNFPGVGRDLRAISRRPKTRAIWSGRPMSRLSRMTCSNGLLRAPYSPGQMTYDLRRLRLAGLIRRIEPEVKRPGRG